MRFSHKICPFHPKFLSLAIVIQIELNLDIRNKFTKEVFPKSNDFPFDCG
jgi:hypothetical protein